MVGVVGLVDQQVAGLRQVAGYLLELLVSGDRAPPPRLIGFHAAESLRTEKAYRHWGHDIGYDDTPLEAGLMFACKLDKPGGFIGRDTLLRRREQGAGRRLLQFLLKEPDAFIYHNEPIFSDGKVVGHITTGTYGHTLGGAVGLGSVEIPLGANIKDVESRPYEVAVAGRRIAAKASLKPLYDPKSDRVRC